MIAQQPHVAPVGAKRDVEHVAEQRHRADDAVQRHIGHHAAISSGGAPSARPR